MNASKYRDTAVEIRRVHQGPNSFGLEVGWRATGQDGPPIEVREELFTTEELSTVHDALRILEEKYVIAYNEWATDGPARLADMIRHAAAVRTELSEMGDQVNRLVHARSSLRAENEDLAGQLASKRAALADVETSTEAVLVERDADVAKKLAELETAKRQMLAIEATATAALTAQRTAEKDAAAKRAEVAALEREAARIRASQVGPVEIVPLAHNEEPEPVTERDP